MKERPILFSGEMVRAILEGRKTQTRRVIKPQPFDDERVGFSFFSGKGKIELRSIAGSRFVKSPYGVPGDRLWVRETWQPNREAGADYDNFHIPSDAVEYAADFSADDFRENRPWKPSIFMPRWASRITLEIVSIRVERVRSITNEDAKAEGCNSIGWLGNSRLDDYRTPFGQLWDKINAKRGFGWDVNPWVWCLEFKKVT